MRGSKARIECLKLLDNWKDRSEEAKRVCAKGGGFLEMLHNCC